MIPLLDDVRPRSLPVTTLALIAINCLVFILALNLRSEDLARVVNVYGMTPAGLHLDRPWLILGEPRVLFSLLTSLFLHHGWFHLLGNLIILAVFGKSVEDRLGHVQFLSFYLLSGVAANLLHAFIYPQNHIPTIGASGAIAGVLGGYFLLFPRARILSLVPLFQMPWLLQLRAALFLGLWFLAQLYSGLFSLSLPEGTNLGRVAWWAHIGGFLIGIVAARLLVVLKPAARNPVIEGREFSR